MHKTYIAILFLSFLFTLPIKGQVVDSIQQSCIPKIDTLNGKQVLYIVEKMPIYPGGESELRKHIAQNIKYEVHSEESFQTRLDVTFVINTSGKVVNTCIVRPKHPDKLTPLEENIVSIMNSLPDWKAGEHNGEKVAVRYTFPIRINPLN